MSYTNEKINVPSHNTQLCHELSELLYINDAYVNSVFNVLITAPLVGDSILTDDDDRFTMFKIVLIV